MSILSRLMVHHAPKPLYWWYVRRMWEISGFYEQVTGKTWRHPHAE